MPLISNSEFNPRLFFRNGHISTIGPSMFRKVEGVRYKRKRIVTPDNDFLDIDFSKIGSKSIAIITHGLEGNSDRAYAKGMVKAVNKAGRDAVVINLRGCSGEPNNLYLSYHSGKTDDLDFVVQHISENYKYDTIMLIGFSLGGNITLKYLGEQSHNTNPLIRRAVAISVPIDLEDSAVQLAKKSNAVYMKRFIKMLGPKLSEKADRFPECGLTSDDISKMKTFYDFDEFYTAPAHGFKNAKDYWKKCSSKPFLKDIRIPTLLINAKNDPFLGDLSYPFTEAENSRFFHLETPKYGGHVGFVNSLKMNGELWNEKRTIDFLKDQK